MSLPPAGCEDKQRGDYFLNLHLTIEKFKERNSQTDKIRCASGENYS